MSGATGGDGANVETDHGGPATAPATGRGLAVAYAVAKAEIRRYNHRYVATRRKRALLLVGAVAFLPLFGGLLLGAYAAGTHAADGGFSALPHVARWWLPVVMGMFALQGAFLTNHLLEFEAQDLLLSTVPDRTLGLGLLGATCWTIMVYSAVPLGALFAAFGLGVGSVTAAVVGAVVAMHVLLASYLVGTTLGLAARLALLRVPMTADARSLYGTVTKVAMIVGFGVLGAVGGSTLGEMEDAKLSLSLLAPSEPTPVPLGHAADWLFVATPLVDGLAATAVASGLAVLAMIPLAALATTRLASRLWYADPARPDDDDAAASESSDLPSFLDGGRLAFAGRTGVVVDALFRRVRRQPTRLAFVGYYLFVPIIVAVSMVMAGDVTVPTAVGGVLGVLGLWLAGGVFCLNPLGEEGSMLGQLLLSETDPRTFVRARLLAGTALGAPLVAAGTALLAVDALSPTRALAAGAYWLALVPASAGLALGVGTLLPSSETRRLLDAIEVRAPETLAIGYHALLVVGLAAAGPLVALRSFDATQVALAAALGVVTVVLGHGGYRFSVAGLADHGRPRREDRAFTLELATGLALGGLLLSTSAGLGAVLLVDAGGLAEFVAAFLGTYVGWATVVAAYCLVSGRTGYLDVRVPTRADLRTGALGTVGLLALWAAVTVAVRTFEVPVSRHSLAGAVTGGGVELLVALVALAVLVNGPVEELLFRNVIQKRLGEAFARRTALAVASLLFALVHLPLYLGGGAVGAAVSLGTLAAVGAVLGLVYDRTGNVVVPALCHGIYNAALFVVLYAAG